jgi:Fe-S-cluster-containing hydrogenase component 2
MTSGLRTVFPQIEVQKSPKLKVKINPNLCAECYTCQLVCSLTYEGICDVGKARITVEPGKISFTEDCIGNCSLCIQYCPFGALTLEKTEEK